MSLLQSLSWQGWSALDYLNQANQAVVTPCSIMRLTSRFADAHCIVRARRHAVHEIASDIRHHGCTTFTRAVPPLPVEITDACRRVADSTAWDDQNPYLWICKCRNTHLRGTCLQATTRRSHLLTEPWIRIAGRTLRKIRRKERKCQLFHFPLSKICLFTTLFSLVTPVILIREPTASGCILCK